MKSALQTNASGSSYWPSPTANNMTGEGTQGRAGGPNLQTAAARFMRRYWSTPAVADAHGTRARRGGKRSKELLLVGQARETTVRCGLRSPTTSTRGDPSSDASLALNPLFDEWLLGWPIGLTGFEPSGTEFRRWFARMRSEFLRLGPDSGTSFGSVAADRRAAVVARVQDVLDGRRQWLVIRGDAATVLSALPAQSFHVVTDPPYDLAAYSTGDIHARWRRTINNDIAAWDGRFDPAALKEPLLRVLRQDGNLVAFTAYNLLGRWHEVYDPLFDTFQLAVWEKPNPTPKLRRQGFLNACELMVFAWNKKHVWNFTKQSEMRNIVRAPVCAGKERLRRADGQAVMPAQKPLKVCEWIIEKISNPGDVILDPYAGVASVGVAALRLGRRYVGIELDPDTAAVARGRLAGYAARVAT